MSVGAWLGRVSAMSVILSRTVLLGIHEALSSLNTIERAWHKSGRFGNVEISARADNGLQ